MRQARTLNGKPVYEAKRKLTLYVKADDVKSARRKDPKACAIARCVVREKIVESARIGTRVALIEYKSHFERYKVPMSTGKDIKRFDEEGSFVVGKYDLLPPASYEKVTGKAHDRGRPSGKHVSRLRPTRSIYKAPK